MFTLIKWAFYISLFYVTVMAGYMYLLYDALNP